MPTVNNTADGIFHLSQTEEGRQGRTSMQMKEAAASRNVMPASQGVPSSLLQQTVTEHLPCASAMQRVVGVSGNQKAQAWCINDLVTEADET